MNREAVKVARRLSNRLPAFPSRREARSRLFAARDEQLSRLKAWAAHATESRLDASPESLKRIEAWYFRFLDEDRFRSIGTNREEFEDCMASYFCHVVVATHADAKWVVEESPFVPGHFGIGVQRGYCTWVGSFRDHFRTPATKSRTKIFRDYQKYFGQGGLGGRSLRGQKANNTGANVRPGK
jgi:hypothetical protein